MPTGEVMSRMSPLSALPTVADAIPLEAALVESAPIDSAAHRHVRLLLLTDTAVLAAGGSERFLRNLVTRLPADRYSITVVQLSGQLSKDIELAPVFARANVDVHVMPVDAVYGRSGWRARKQLHDLLRRERFDIVQSHHEKADILNAVLPRQAGSLRISNRRDMGFKKSRKLKQAFRWLNHRFDTVVAPSIDILDNLAEQESLDRRRTLWIPNGVDTTAFRPPTAGERVRARRALGLDGHELVLGCVARLAPVKCHHDLVAAFAVLHQQRPDARLLLIGDGPLRGEIKRQVEAAGLGDVVLLLGDREDIDAVLPAMDIAVLSSSSEGMSNALLEAMACGLPVIATAVGANPQLVGDGVNGLLSPPCAPDLLARSMIALATSPARCRAMGAASRLRVETEHSLSRMVDAYDRMYQQLLEAA